MKKAFEGIKVVEFGSGAAGPISTRYLGDFGATVVRVESRQRPDFLRIYPPHVGSPQDLDGAISFGVLNPNKLSVTINLRDPKGQEVAKRLAKWADIVSENFSPGNMQKFGLAYDDLKKVNPTLIMVSGCLQGQTGPHKDYPGFGGQGSALSGFNYWAGWPDREPVGPNGTISDTLAPRFMATAVIGALHYRRRTGKGIYLDISQVEACAYTLGWAVLEVTANKRLRPRLANRSEWAAPHAAFPTKGDDRWIAIAAENDAEWNGLVEAMDSPAWAKSPDYETTLARLKRVDELEKRIGEWTRQFEAHDLMKRLQQHGVQAGVVQNIEDNWNDPVLAERKTFTMQKHPKIGEYPLTHTGSILPKSPRGIERAAPLLGEHTRKVLHEFAGLSEAEITELEKAGVLQ
ncbi:MAG: CoA transferase [Chloroflexi bacterium]|nr:CoA transferase [Chloroflexota bacterium]